MNKNIFSWLIPFWIYIFIVLCLIVSIRIIPYEYTDLRILLCWGIYFPYIHILIYIIGFILGCAIQKTNNISPLNLQFKVALVSFITTFIVLNMYTFDLGPKAIFFYSLIPAFISSLLFFTGEIITKTLCDKHK